jgi:hypothetical protein
MSRHVTACERSFSKKRKTFEFSVTGCLQPVYDENCFDETLCRVQNKHRDTYHILTYLLNPTETHILTYLLNPTGVVKWHPYDENCFATANLNGKIRGCGDVCPRLGGWVGVYSRLSRHVNVFCCYMNRLFPLRSLEFIPYFGRLR